MQTKIDPIITVIILGTLIFLGLSAFVVSFLFFFNKKQAQYRQEKADLKARYDREILKSQLEVQNSTLQEVGQELHDNIGQLLSVAKINLSILESLPQEVESLDYIKQTTDVISQSIKDLRSLTKSLDGDFVQDFGLLESINHELHRIEKTKRFKTSTHLDGEMYSLGYDREIVLFRIFQEILNNAIKHSRANMIHIDLLFAPEKFTLAFNDDGEGFDYEEIMSQELSKSGAGLRNIFRRVELIGGQCIYKSAKNQGTQVSIELAVETIPNLTS
ncbi:sensor histidine kinase [Spirosoma aureum]|uniref:histidine kinase n=1 Tax=Spirosoma aureum TaxID=2692134 RepID=A0A6G9ASR8_9BACT|nr:ATP-binding protein [Spirosoma aureum]QIP15376.1 sensor histidine kinase [Spirosoma aureum]